jgi:exodeoxyribonuclease V beta subunit
VLNWLVGGRGHSFDDWLSEPPDEAALSARWQALAGGPITLQALPSVTRRTPLESLEDHAAHRQARTNRRPLRDQWRMASFSGLIAAGGKAEETHAAAEDVRPDHDELADALSPAPVSSPAPQAPSYAEDDILAFPRGAAAGDCLHRMFELADFADPHTWTEAIRGALRERPAPAVPELAVRLPTMMQNLLADIVATELVPGMTLAQLDPRRRMNELEFLFAAPSLDFPALRELLIEHGYPDVALEPGVLRGFVKGFIDMIVEHDGRFWIVDWKSNHLGDTAADYAAAPLDAAMASHAYHLQALLYTVALHRYLKTRVRDYSYDTHIGGYLYLFVRGVRPQWRDGDAPAGVHRRRPAFELVALLDAAMIGGAA